MVRMTLTTIGNNLALYLIAVLAHFIINLRILDDFETRILLMAVYVCVTLITQLSVLHCGGGALDELSGRASVIQGLRRVPLKLLALFLVFNIMVVGIGVLVIKSGRPASAAVTMASILTVLMIPMFLALFGTWIPATLAGRAASLGEAFSRGWRQYRRMTLPMTGGLFVMPIPAIACLVLLELAGLPLGHAGVLKTGDLLFNLVKSILIVGFVTYCWVVVTLVYMDDENISVGQEPATNKPASAMTSRISRTIHTGRP